jgi:hypothetical protein
MDGFEDDGQVSDTFGMFLGLHEIEHPDETGLFGFKCGLKGSENFRPYSGWDFQGVSGESFPDVAEGKVLFCLPSNKLDARNRENDAFICSLLITTPIIGPFAKGPRPRLGR